MNSDVVVLSASGPNHKAVASVLCLWTGINYNFFDNPMAMADLDAFQVAALIFSSRLVMLMVVANRFLIFEL